MLQRTSPACRLASSKTHRKKGLMSVFKFLCPGCGQKILGDTAYSGVPIACPTCQKSITIPAADPAGCRPTDVQPAPPAAHPATGLAARLAPTAAAAGRTSPGRVSALAVASLICSGFVPLGSIPGMICGHLAKARMRRNIFLEGEEMANAGLLISYCVLIAMLAVSGVFLLERWHFRPAKVMRESPEAIAAMQPRIVDEVDHGAKMRTTMMLDGTDGTTQRRTGEIIPQRGPRRVVQLQDESPAVPDDDN